MLTISFWIKEFSLCISSWKDNLFLSPSNNAFVFSHLLSLCDEPCRIWHWDLERQKTLIWNHLANCLSIIWAFPKRWRRWGTRHSTNIWNSPTIGILLTNYWRNEFEFSIAPTLSAGQWFLTSQETEETKSQVISRSQPWIEAQSMLPSIRSTENWQHHQFDSLH